jgi:hypothetical protein
MAQEVWRLRQEPSIIAHLPGGITLRATSDPSRKWSGGWGQRTIPQLHQAGGWLGGSSIHSSSAFGRRRGTVGHLRLPLPGEGAGVQFICRPWKAGIHPDPLRSFCAPVSAGAPGLGPNSLELLGIPSCRLQAAGAKGGEKEALVRRAED